MDVIKMTDLLENREFWYGTVLEDIRLSLLDSGFTKGRMFRLSKIQTKLFGSILANSFFHTQLYLYIRKHAWDNLVSSWKVTVDRHVTHCEREMSDTQRTLSPTLIKPVVSLSIIRSIEQDAIAKH